MKKILLALLFFCAPAFAYVTVPGEVTPSVKPANVGGTICKTGYTDSVRPSTYYTNTVKALLTGPDEAAARACVGIEYLHRQDWNKAAYACAAKMPVQTDAALLASVKLDHKVPLEVGGHPNSLHNLQVQTLAESRTKDRSENAARAQVCAGKLTLRAAQRHFAAPTK